MSRVYANSDKRRSVNVYIIRGLFEEITKGNGEAACKLFFSCATYVTSQQGSVSKFHHWNTLVRRDILPNTGLQASWVYEPKN